MTLGIFHLHICDSFLGFMCGRYRRTTSEEELARLYHIPIPNETDLPISYNIAPQSEGSDDPIQSRNPGTIA